MRIEHIIANITDAAFEDDDRFRDVSFRLANWEDDWDAQDRNFRNYRNSGSEDLLAVVEHATRRGENLELQITVQIGNVHDFPEDVKDAKEMVRRKQEAQAVLAEAEAEKARIDREAQARVDKLLGK